jgi:hypothetical protein
VGGLASAQNQHLGRAKSAPGSEQNQHLLFYYLLLYFKIVYGGRGRTPRRRASSTHRRRGKARFDEDRDAGHRSESPRKHSIARRPYRIERSKRFVGPPDNTFFAYSTEGEQAQLEAWWDAILSVRPEDARGIWHDLFVKAHPLHKANASRILALVEARWGYLPGTPREAPNADLTAFLAANEDVDAVKEGEDFILDAITGVQP